MRRADRLFEIIQTLRRRPVTRASDLAAELEVSERTIYRDIQDLMASGVPIEGEAGVGYVLRAGFDMPPLMFTEREIEALMLGVRIVESWADEDLARAAMDVAAKVEAVVPERLRDHMACVPLLAPAEHAAIPLTFDLGALRRALGERRKVAFAYRDVVGDVTERVVRPLSLAYFGPVWLLAAWCELRNDFRTFRLDRISGFTPTQEHFRDEPGRTLHDFLKRDRTWSRGKRDDPPAKS